MRELVLLVPDLFLPADGGLEALPVPLLPQRFGAARPVRGGWRAWLAARLERADLALAGEAEVVALAAGAGADSDVTSEAAAGTGYWLATPVGFAAGLDHVRMPLDGLLELDADSSIELAADFQRVLGGGELELRPVAPDAFLLRGLAADGAVTSDPARSLGTDIGAALPSGPGSRALRALMAEIEMWLHEHPVNRRRAAQGRAAISNLWLWGGGAAPPSGAGAASEMAHGVLIMSADAWVVAVARLAGAGVQGPSSGIATLLQAPADIGIAVLPRSVAQFEAQVLPPALEALRRGALREIWLVGNDRAVSLRDSDRLRLWRPARGWLAALH